MSVRLHHPESGGQFDAAESAVPQWRRAGWVPAAELAAEQARNPAAGTPASTTQAAGTAEEPNEE